MVLTRFGGYADAINVPAATLWPVPADWSSAQAAAYPVQALTAWYGIERLGNARQDSIVLVQSAAGGVGLHALQALRTLEAKPVAVVGSERKRQWLIDEHGLAPQAVVIRDRHYSAHLDAALRHYGASGFDVIFDAVYGDAFQAAFDRLAPEGRYVLFGAADFMGGGMRPNPFRLLSGWLRRPRLDPLAMIPLNRGLLAFNLIWLWEQADRLPESMRATLALIPSPPHIGARFRFEEALEAMKLLQSGQTTGKVVLELPVE
jgi:alcohol dehydrogenase